MGKPHKFANAAIDLRTRIPADRLAQLTKEVGDNTKFMGSGVRFEGAAVGVTNFSVRGLAGFSELLTFHVAIADDAGGAIGRSEIDSYKTTQQTYMMIPVSPKSMTGYPLYKKFMNTLADVVRREDPGAQISIVERVQ